MNTAESVIAVWWNSDGKPECDWGVIDYPRPQFDGQPPQVGSLMLLGHPWRAVSAAADGIPQRSHDPLDWRR